MMRLRFELDESNGNFIKYTKVTEKSQHSQRVLLRAAEVCDQSRPQRIGEKSLYLK